MQKYPSNVPPSSASMRPGISQAGSQPPASRPAASRFVRPAPESVSRSEAGVSVDLSAASNTAANGEDPMDLLHHGSTTGGGEQKPPVEQHAKSMEAEKWFQDSNRNASTRGNVSFVDDDPPFHLPSNLPNDFPKHPLPVRTNSNVQASAVRPMQSMQSSGSEEFRSVIDDLTVENKMLKKEVRQLRRRNVTHTHPDKLFEVRMHGLDAREKKNLMQMLKEFNNSLSKSRGNYMQPSAKKGSKVGSKPSSASTTHSNSNPVDSAYASGSTSGHASASQVTESRNTIPSEVTSRSRRTEKDQNVRSYLMNMSSGLLPKQTTVMTEKARNKLVVRKLEQLYTGKPSTSKNNSQTDQQQQVSTEAANEHKRQTEAVGRTVPAEGSREALILPSDSDIPTFQHESSTVGSHAHPSPGKQDSSSGLPDQRPTRPLDLDLSRAQNPAENIAYIGHLGFKSSDKGPIEQQPGGGGAWVPLNLLMNLAQLHTLNVTPDHVRQAIKELSDRFEIASDGNKIRWKGGTEGTRLHGESGSSANSNENSPADGTQNAGGGRGHSPSRSRSSKPSASDQPMSGVKGSDATDPSRVTKTSSRDISASTGQTSSGNLTGNKRPLFLGSTSREDSFSYQPIFLHGAGSEEENEYYLDEDDSLLSSAMREDITGSGSGQRSRRLAMPSKEEGAVIFYHRAKFCTDLSGDYDAVPVNTTQYDRVQCAQVGAPPSPGVDKAETKAFISADEGVRRAVATDVDTDGPEIGIPTGSTFTSAASRPVLTDPYPLPMTGIGSTMPADNFALWPKYQQKTNQCSQPLISAGKRFMRVRLFGSEKVNRVARGGSTNVSLVPKGCVKRELPPSEFPSPGFFNQWSSSESADGWSDSEGAEDESKSQIEAGDIPVILPTLANTTFESHSGDDGDSGVERDDEADPNEMEADDDSDDDVIDMLAYEREQNAEEIARREREWDEQAKQAEDEDDGEGKRSSAATVGDRSFLSDEDDISPGHISSTAVAGHKREREERVPPESSPAKRVESSRTRTGKK